MPNTQREAGMSAGIDNQFLIPRIIYQPLAPKGALFNFANPSHSRSNHSQHLPA
jgi:hypothetical protein